MTHILITGASRYKSLGYEMARQIGLINTSKYHVIISGRNESELESSLKTLRDEGISCSSVVMDLLDSKSVKATVEAIKKDFGYINILVNNAALMKAGGSVELQNLDEMREVLETNLIGAWRVT